MEDLGDLRDLRPQLPRRYWDGDPEEREKDVPVRSCCLGMCLKHLKEARVLRLEGRTGRTGGRIPKV